MTNCCSAGHDFYFSLKIPDFEPFEIAREGKGAIPVPVLFPQSLAYSIVGLVAGAQRQVEIWDVPSGFLLKIVGSRIFHIASNAHSVLCLDERNREVQDNIKKLEEEVLLGPVLVLALAMRNTWSLHASSAIFQNQTFAFLGESGQGKSTLAAYLNSTDWERVADDILPATLEASGAQVWPRFPQLKLPPDKQPGFNFPKKLPLDRICVLASAEENADPELELLSPSQAIQVLLSHTAGTRLFEPKLLKKHLDFCAGVAEQIPVYRLAYPHRRDTLPRVKELLENLC